MIYIVNISALKTKGTKRQHACEPPSDTCGPLAWLQRSNEIPPVCKMRGWIHTRLPRDWRWRTPPPALSLAIRCVREIWTGKWGIRNQSCAWNADYPQANRRTQIFSLRPSIHGAAGISRIFITSNSLSLFQGWNTFCRASPMYSEGKPAGSWNCRPFYPRLEEHVAFICFW